MLRITTPQPFIFPQDRNLASFGSGAFYNWKDRIGQVIHAVVLDRILSPDVAISSTISTARVALPTEYRQDYGGK